MLHGTDTTLRGDATQRDSMQTGRAKKIRAPKTGRGNYKRVHVYMRMHAHARARARMYAATIFDVKDTEEKSQSNWQVWNMWPRQCKNIGPPSSLLNVHRTGAKPTHDRIFQLRVVVWVFSTLWILHQLDEQIYVSGIREIITCEQMCKM